MGASVLEERGGEGLDRAAVVVSHLLNPALVGCWVFVSLMWMDWGDWKAGVVGLVFYALVPGLSLILLLRNGFVRDLYPPERSQRGRLLLLGTACYFLGFVALIMAGASKAMLSVGCTFFSNALIVWRINYHWKISIHAVAVAGGILITVFAFGSDVWPFVLALPLVAWARLRLRSHTLAQVVVGGALGVITSGLVVHLFSRL